MELGALAQITWLHGTTTTTFFFSFSAGGYFFGVLLAHIIRKAVPSIQVASGMQVVLQGKAPKI
mgnify:CR=1 FL=1